MKASKKVPSDWFTRRKTVRKVPSFDPNDPKSGDRKPPRTVERGELWCVLPTPNLQVHKRGGRRYDARADPRRQDQIRSERPLSQREIRDILKG